MLPIQVFVRKADVVVDLEVIEPGDYSVISIINDAKKELLGASVTSKDKWELSIIFPWNGVKHTILTDEELMIVFKEFDRRDLPSITFDLNVIPILVEAPGELHALLQCNKEPILLLQQNEESIPNIEDHRLSIERAQTKGENEWELGSEESDGQLDDSSLDMNYSSDEDKDPMMVARYCYENQWTPNPNGSIELKKGQIFGNAKMVKDVVKRNVIQEGFQLKKLKNDRRRYIVRCKNETCEWRFNASCLPDGVTFMIRNVGGVHTFCQRTNRNKEANSKWVAAVLQNSILANPSIATKDLKNQLQENYAIKCGNQTIYKAKKRVLKTLTVDHVNSYAKIRKYANAVIAMNRNTKAKVMIDRSLTDIPRFQRFFLSYNAIQIGFVRGCRPLIVVDGCHLTGEFEGVMLSAIALDADSGIFPLAYCVCEVEKTDTWVWFLKLLSEALNWDDSRPICFISDRQKGLINALKQTWPRAGKRHCFRHIIANFNATYKNLNMTGKLWAASRSGDAAEFKAIMESIKEESVQAYNYLMKAKPKRWARHTFDQRIKSDHNTNNMSECFNNWIKEDRDKPILTLMESLRRKMMLRFHEKCEEIEKLQDTVSSYARERLNENEKEGRKLQVIHGMGEYYETLDNFNNKVIVNLNEKTCDCKMWEISGIPCKHAIAVFCFNRQFAHESVDWYYSREALKLTYSGCINPVPEEHVWPEFAEEELIEHPKKHPKVGRPKKNRRREPDEEPARAKFSRRCTNCHGLGHNSRTCPKAAAKGKGARQGGLAHIKSTSTTRPTNTFEQGNSSNISQQQGASQIVPPEQVGNVYSQYGSTSQI